MSKGASLPLYVDEGGDVFLGVMAGEHGGCGVEMHRSRGRHCYA